MTLPLWSPTHVGLGAVGYLSKPKGEFITLFNAMDPLQSNEERLHRLPSMYGYGKVEVQNREEAKRSMAQRGLEAISGFLTFRTRGDRLNTCVILSSESSWCTDKVGSLGNALRDNVHSHSYKGSPLRKCTWKGQCIVIWTIWTRPRRGLSNM